MDKVWWERYGSLSHHQRGKRRQQGLGNVELVRYADDFLILTNGSKVTTEGLKAEFRDILNALGLTLCRRKRSLPMSMMVWTFSVLTSSADPSGLTRVRKRCTYSNRTQYPALQGQNPRNAGDDAGDVVNKIRAINRVVRGWGNYYRHVQSIRCRQKLDHWTYTAVWLWLGKKHGGNLGS